MEAESFRPQRQPPDDPLVALELDRIRREAESKQRQKDRMEERILKAEGRVDQLRTSIRKKAKELTIVKPKPFVPVEPVKKSRKLLDMETSIQKGTFFEEGRTKDIMERTRATSRMLKYEHAFGGAYMQSSRH